MNIDLPLHSAAGMLALEQVAPAPVAVGAPQRVLVVDDNVDGADMLAHLLTAHGHTVEVHYDPVAALAAFDAFRPDVALLDIGLPVLDGYQLAARIQALPAGQGCRLIALSGYGQATDRARSQASGFEAHMVKPISGEEAVRVVAGKAQSGQEW
jgi:CheY-like chemotaxis protein